MQKRNRIVKKSSKGKKHISHPHLALLFVYGIVVLWSFSGAQDYSIWFLEAAMTWATIGLLIITYDDFRFSDLVYVLIIIHATVLLIGARYTYDDVPFFDWMQHEFDLSKNYYDTIGYLARGFVPAIVIRELIKRLTPVKTGGWIFIITITFVLSIALIWGFIEWGLTSAVAPMGNTIGFDVNKELWDRQADMFTTLIGALLALMTMPWLHDQSLLTLRRERHKSMM